MEVDEVSFQSHLKSLNIGAVDVSFGWLLDDGNEILNWIFKNVDSGNCLSPEDRAQYAILEQTGKVLSESELEKEVDAIFVKYNGISDPSVQDALYRNQSELEDLEEMSNLLKEQERMRDSLLVQDKKIISDIVIQQNTLNEVLACKSAELADVMKECQEIVNSSWIEKLKYVRHIEDLLFICVKAKNVGNKLFFSEKPLKIYYERTKLLESYLKLYLTRQFDDVSSNNRIIGVDAVSLSTLHNTMNDLGDDSNMADSKVSKICKKLEDGLWFYMKNKAALNGILEEIKYVHTYDMDCCYDSHFEKIKNTGLVEVLEKDIEIFSQQHITLSVQKFINQQCEQLLLGEVLLKLEKTKYVHNKLCETEAITRKALNHNILLHMCLQRDQLCVENFLKFSMDAINDLQSAISANKSRVTQLSTPKESQYLIEMLRSLFDVDQDMAVMDLAKKIELTLTNVESLERNVFHEQFVELARLLNKRKEDTLPLRKMIWGGPTDHPVICNELLGRMLHEVKIQNSSADEKIQSLAKNFIQFKKNVENQPNFCIDNLWMTFLCEPDKIIQFQETHQAR